MTEIDLVAVETDAAAVGHGDRLVVERVRELVQAAIDTRNPFSSVSSAKRRTGGIGRVRRQVDKA